MDGRSGEGVQDAGDQVDDHGAFLEAQRRIVAAFETMAAAKIALDARHAEVTVLEERAAHTERLQAELDEERTANAQLQERVRVLRERAEGTGDGAAQARLSALAATRAAEQAELDAVLSELIPIVEDLR